MLRMTKRELMDALSNQYSEEQMKKMTKAELQAEYDLYCDDSGMFPNDDQYDGSHEYD